MVGVGSGRKGILMVTEEERSANANAGSLVGCTRARINDVGPLKVNTGEASTKEMNRKGNLWSWVEDETLSPREGAVMYI